MTAILQGTGIIPTSQRLEERARFGDLNSMLEHAVDEQAAGNLLNARSAYRAVLAEWLRQEWIRKSGRVNTPITDPAVLEQKLLSSLTIDRWTSRAIRLAITPPEDLRWLHVDLLAGVVSAVCFGFPTIAREEGGAL